MQPLLKIASVPISIEYSVKRAALQHNPSAAPPVRAHGRSAQTYRAPQPVQRSTPEQQQRQQTQNPQQTKDFSVPQGAKIVYDENGMPVMDASAPVQQAEPAAPAVAPAPTYSSPQAPVITGSATAPVNYQMDKSTFDWNATAKPQLEYVPASLEFSVAQYPELNIEYVGSPIYVPRSADPDYVPPPGVDDNA